MAEKRQAFQVATTHAFRLFRLAVAGCGAMLALGCGDLPPTYPYDKEPNPLKSEYVIGAGDDLWITVFQHDEFNARVTVRPDGTVTAPLLGDLHAEGHTPAEFKAVVLESLGQYLKEGTNPLVTVAVTGANSYFVTVAGSVERPGRFQAPSYLTVADAIALAGGPDRFASPDEAFVLRRGKNGQYRKIPINYEQIRRGEHLEQNILLLTGDQVMIP